jgi:hypothetical protein
MSIYVLLVHPSWIADSYKDINFVKYNVPFVSNHVCTFWEGGFIHFRPTCHILLTSFIT